MRSNLRRIAALALLILALTGLGGCGFINQLRAKNRLNEGVRTFNRGKYDEAEQMFKEALGYDPENVNAKFFYAMALNARFEKALNSQEVDKAATVEFANNTIAAFQNVIDAKPKFSLLDKAYAFIAKAYKSLSDQVYGTEKDAAETAATRAKYLEYLEKRALLPEQKPDVKAQMYYTIGYDYWDTEHKGINAFEKRDPTNKLPPTYSGIPADKRAKFVDLMTKSHEYMQKAIKEDPDYPDPYLGEKLLYFDELNITEDVAQREVVKAHINEWDEQHRAKLSAKQAAEAAEAGAAGQ